MRFTAIDFETANEKRSSACALGIACIDDGRIIEQQYYLIRPPELYFNHYNVAIHGIREQDVINKPDFAELWPSIKQNFVNSIVISHNASFDMSVLRATLDYYNITYPNLKYGCTWIMSKNQWPDRLSYKLNDVAAMLDINFDHHHAVEDAKACAQIALQIIHSNNSSTFNELASTLDFSIGSLYPGGYTPSSNLSNKKCVKKINETKLTTRNGVKKQIENAIFTLEGIIKGIAIDGIVNVEEVAELENWYRNNRDLMNHHPFKELVSLLDNSLIDGVISSEERKDILWMCNKYHPDSIYRDWLSNEIKKLQGILHGIIADNRINTLEIENLSEWLMENEHLTGLYPYDELCSLTTIVLKDGQLSDEEIKMLKVFFNEFIDDRSINNLNDSSFQSLENNMSLPGVCAVCPPIIFENRMFCFTGESSRATRTEIADLINSLGGMFKNTVVKNTDYLIVGNEGNPCWAFSCYGRKVEKAVKMRKTGSNILIVHENDFWDEIGAN